MTDALAVLADTIFPATDGLGAASELGAVDYVRTVLEGPRGRGENRYAAAPFVQPEHGGHGWQWRQTPAEGVEHLLDVLGDDDLPARLVELEAGSRGDDLARAAFALLCTLVLEGVLSDPRHGGNAGGAAWRWIGYAGGTR